MRLDINVQLGSLAQYKSILDKNVNLVEWKEQLPQKRGENINYFLLNSYSRRGYLIISIIILGMIKYYNRKTYTII